MAPAIDGSGATVPLLPYPLDPGAVLEMDPDGPNLAIAGLGPRAEGQEIALVLVFAEAGTAEAHVAVEGADAESRSHAGHDH